MANDEFFWRALVNTTTYTAWTIPLSMAIGLGLAYALVVEGLIFGFGASLISWLRNVQQWFPIANTGYLTDSLGSVKIRGIPPSPPPFADAMHAVLVLTTYLVVFVVISAVLVRRRDVTN